MPLEHELFDVTTLPFEDVADFMQTDIVGMPNSMRALAVTRVCGIAIGGEIYELEVGNVIIDAPQKMKRMACDGGLFEFLFGARP